MTGKSHGVIDDGLGCLVLLLGYHQFSVDQQQLHHALGGAEPATSKDLVRLARRIGARAKSATIALSRLKDTPLPIIAKLTDGFVVVAAARDEQVLLQRPGGTPDVIAIEVLDETWTGEVVLVTRRAEALTHTAFDVTWFVPALMKYRRLLGEVIAASFVLQIFALATPLIFQVVIDKVLAHHGLTTLNVLIIALSGVVLMDAVLGGLRATLFTHTTSRVDVELGARLYRHLLALPMAYFESRRVGDTIARVRELETIRQFLTSSSVTLIIDLCFTMIFLAVMWVYSSALMLVTLTAIALYAVTAGLITKPLRLRIEERFRRSAESQAFLVETVSSMQTLKAAAVEPQMQGRWERLLAGYVSAGYRAAALNIWGGQAIQLINKIATVATLFIGAKLVLAGRMTIGELVAFNMLAGRIAEPVLRLAGVWQQFQEARVGVARLGDILNTPTETQFSPSRSALPDIAGHITFDDVTFRYRPGGREALRRVTLDISPGEVVGIVGPSGSGKSTLTKLAQRLYVPESGRVLIDGVDLAQVDPAWLRRQIGVVLQENLLFNRTVRDNIALADPALPMDAVVSAAKTAGAHEFILELAEGYDTVLEERGANLSGGQRQRIAIARALITNPRILILDEATSALDAESEAILQTNMRAIVSGRTVLIIAHRLSAIRTASRIVTVESGQITEEGNHHELMAKAGRYAQLWRAQNQEQA